MKKLLTFYCRSGQWRKILLTMKLVFIFLLGSLMTVHASSYSQNSKLNLDLKKASIRSVLNEIEEQTNYYFFFNEEEFDVDKKVSVSLKDASVGHVLESILQNSGMEYDIVDNYVVIRKAGSKLTKSQQEQTVSGNVKDESGEALPGVAVIVKGTTTGTTTDIDGNFTLVVPAGAKALQFSFVGMKMQEVELTGQAVVNVVLVTDAIGLEEVVAVGYGVQKKVSLTNAVSQVTGEDIVKRPVADVTQSLQGMASGVFVLDNGGRPGSSDVNIRIRGMTTINDDNSIDENAPLIIVDGIEQRMGDINPDDIESVSILKDAASTAIYGSRAANGVILITTRRAKEGEVRVAYHGYVGVQRAINRPEHLDLRSYFELENVARINAGGEAKYSEDYINEYVNATDREQYPLPFPWFDKGVMLKNAPQQNHTLSFSGGNEFIKARASVRYQDIDGIVSNFKDKTNEVRVNTDFKVSDKLDFSFDLNVRSSENQEPSAGVYNVFNYMLHATKFSYPQYPTGEYGLGPQNNNPLIFAELSGLSTVKNDYFIGRVKGNYQILPSLKYSLEYGVRNSDTERSRFYNKYRNEDPNTGRVRAVTVNSLQEYRSNFREYTLSHLLNFSKDFNEHTVNVLAGYSTVDNRQNNLSAERQDFYNNEIQSIGSGSNENKDNDGRNSEYGLRSYFGRATYNYDNKYFAEVNARYDGSSRFSSKKQYAFFPSFSAGWRISQEDFWSNLSETINELKLRASWGLTGNQAISLYEFYPALSPIDYAFNETAVQGYAQKQFVNSDLTWEKTEQLDIGVDMGLWNSRLTFSADYYDKLTKDILLKLPIPATIGLDASYQNAGSVRNKGWEASVTYRGGNKLQYQIGANLSRNKNVVEDLLGTGPYISGGGANQTTIIQEGMAINSLWGYHTDGYFQSEEEIANYPTLQANTKPGDVKYLDLNDDKKITPEDRAFLGYSFPVYTMGATMKFSYADFELFMQWQGATGHTTQVAGGLAHQATYEAFTHKVHGDYWTEDNRNARWPRPIKSNLRNLQASDLLTIDADYLRLKNIMLSYKVKSTLLQKLSIRDALVYVNATNVLTFSKLNEWDLDAEMPPGRANYYPQVGLYTIGLKLNF